MGRRPVTVEEGGEPPFHLSTDFFSFVASGNSAPRNRVPIATVPCRLSRAALHSWEAC